MTTSPQDANSQEELEAKLSEDLKHTLKLVPTSQRKLFIFELAKYLPRLIAAREQAAVERVLDDLAVPRGWETQDAGYRAWHERISAKRQSLKEGDK